MISLDPGNVDVATLKECLSPLFAEIWRKSKISVMATIYWSLLWVNYALERPCDVCIMLLDPKNVDAATSNEYLSPLFAKLWRKWHISIMATLMRPIVGEIFIGEAMWCLHYVARPWTCGYRHFKLMSIIIRCRATSKIVNFGNGRLYRALFQRKTIFAAGIHPKLVQYRLNFKSGMDATP